MSENAPQTAHSRIAVIAFGSNLGDRSATIDSARRALDAHPLITVVAMSNMHESVALKLHGEDNSAPPYINAVALVETSLTAGDLLAELMRIERDHGRERAERWGDRTLDLDIVAIGSETLATNELTLPHPRAHERLFVLEPWFEVQPNAQLAGRPVAELIRELATHTVEEGAR